MVRINKLNLIQFIGLCICLIASFSIGDTPGFYLYMLGIVLMSGVLGYELGYNKKFGRIEERIDNLQGVFAKKFALASKEIENLRTEAGLYSEEQNNV